MEVNNIDKHRAHGINPNMTRFAQTPEASPIAEAAVMARMKIRV
jgi:hypothetical protein